MKTANMRVKRQRGPSCYGHALFNAGIISAATRDDYEATMLMAETMGTSVATVGAVAPTLTEKPPPFRLTFNAEWGVKDRATIPKRGRGIVIVRTSHLAHAVAYRAGFILDSGSWMGSATPIPVADYLNTLHNAGGWVECVTPASHFRS